MGDEPNAGRRPEPTDAKAAPDAELRRIARGPDGPPTDFDALFGELERDLDAERGVRGDLRALATAQRAGVCMLFVAVLAAAALLVFARPDLHVYPSLRMGLALAVLGAGLASNVWLALRPLHRPALPAWAAPAVSFGALLALLAFYALPAAHTAHAASLQLPGAGAVLRRALPCLGAGLALGLAAFGMFGSMHRGGWRSGLVLAAAAGLTANLVLQLHCPVTAPSHMIAGHFGVALLLVAGAVLGRRVRPARSVRRAR